ncbi:hypothetical protein [Photobacterium kishitanii]|uniref:hypothetical protein n=1 Tax=Photobacterium kishitanii TaxID=318456 RepID=UPI0011B28164|nr:hypothetical protein [Photobacterium kishitanii]
MKLQALFHHVKSASRELPCGFKYEVIRIDIKTLTEVAFINSPDWATSNEPIVGDSAVVSIKNGTHHVKLNNMRKTNAQIYHHKWLFVGDSNEGFNVADSKKRSLTWLKAKGTEKNSSLIGNSNYWDSWLHQKGLQPRIPLSKCVFVVQ